MNRLAAFAALIFVLGLSQQALASEPCTTENAITMTGASDAPWTVQIELDPVDVPLNKPFDADVTVCAQSQDAPARVTVDATMPAHKHGMNYEPKMTQVDDSNYQVENLLFHMPGVWQLEVTAYDRGKPYRFTHDVKVQ